MPTKIGSVVLPDGHRFVQNVRSAEIEPPLALPQLDFSPNPVAVTNSARSRRVAGNDTSMIFYRYGQPVVANAAQRRADGQDRINAGDVADRISDGRNPGDPGVPPRGNVAAMIGGAGMDDGTDRIADEGEVDDASTWPPRRIATEDRGADGAGETLRTPTTLIERGNGTDSTRRGAFANDQKGDSQSNNEADADASDSNSGPSRSQWDGMFKSAVNSRKQRAIA